MTRRTSRLTAPFLALGFAIGATALAAEPMVSVPSTPGSDGKVEIRGSDLAPLTNVTVRFAHAQATPADVVAQTTANGSFVLRYQPPLAGGYKVSVFDSAGRLIGKGSFGVSR